MFKTAKARVSCSQFNAGEFVSVEFSGWCNGQAWYAIKRSQNGQLAHTVEYPAKHLTEFCL